MLRSRATDHPVEALGAHTVGPAVAGRKPRAGVAHFDGFLDVECVGAVENGEMVSAGGPGQCGQKAKQVAVDHIMANDSYPVFRQRADTEVMTELTREEAKALPQELADELGDWLFTNGAGRPCAVMSPRPRLAARCGTGLALGGLQR